MNPCKITQDLLPLYVENVCSKSSREYVEAHLTECAECQALLRTMNTNIQGMSTQQNAKKSFSNFKRKILLRRIGWTVVSLALCVALYIALVSSNFMQANHHLPLDAVSTSVSQLSDGSVHVLFESNRKNIRFSMEWLHLLPEDPYTLCIQLYHDYINDFHLPPFNFNRKEAQYIFITDESAPLYNMYLNNGHRDDVIRKIVLVGADGERVLWEKGDALPPASEEAESRLQREIDDGYLVPIG